MSAPESNEAQQCTAARVLLGLASRVVPSAAPEELPSLVRCLMPVDAECVSDSVLCDEVEHMPKGE